MMRLYQEPVADGKRKIVYERLWRKNFVGEALTVLVAADRQIEWIEFYTGDLGMVRWVPGRGFGVAKRWENDGDDQADGGKTGRRNAAVTHIHQAADAGDVIADRVLDALKGTKVANFIGVQLKYSGQSLRWTDDLMPREED